jgi:hypothetical protein
MPDFRNIPKAAFIRSLVGVTGILAKIFFTYLFIHYEKTTENVTMCHRQGKRKRSERYECT